MQFLNIRSGALAVAMLGAAAPAVAQDTYCGGAGNGGQWIGGDAQSSDIATAGSYQEQMALVLGGNEYISLFSLSQGTDVRIEAAGRGAGDTIIDVLDSNGSIVASDDDSGGNAASRAETYLEAGTYCMALRSYDGGPMTAFVRVGRQEHEALTEGVMDSPVNDGSAGGCATATPMGGLGSSVTGSVADNPNWSFTLDAPAQISITAENESADPVVTLYGANDMFIAENDDYDGLNSRIDVTDTLDPGTYCIAMAALSDEYAPITVSLTEYDPEAATLSLYDRGEAAPPLDGSIPVTDLGVLESRVRQDVQATDDVTWFTLEVLDNSLLVIEAIGGGNSDPWLVVYDDLGREVGMNDDYGDGLDSLVMARVQSGTYIVGVRQFDNTAGLIRLLAERYVRAQ
ncbi:hypothetical protein SAMN04488005_2428 [Yoonia tamlensis]|uniref:Pre-peptidase C-terminal domain-containing protein n=1 Tax=Yoonia tamlensis TaxID=390270 RepID=A0A1I6H9Y5_9RHOB|nr:ABC transporter substrate-binding protein [Yoonia tamlensis]SFR51356.1 hypothetical protein SAMN04488005_2428 [Yoonia tamlensis]